MGQGREGSSPEGKRKTPHTSTEAFIGQDLSLWLGQSIQCMQMMRVQPRCLPQTGHRFPRQWLRAPSPCSPTWTEPLKSSACTLLRTHTPCSLYPSSYPSCLPSPAAEPMLGEVCPGHGAIHLGPSVMVLSLGQLGKPDLGSGTAWS